MLSQVRREDREAVSRLVRRSLSNYSGGRSWDELLAWLRLPEDLLRRTGRTAEDTVRGRDGSQRGRGGRRCGRLTGDSAAEVARTAGFSRNGGPMIDGVRI